MYPCPTFNDCKVYGWISIFHTPLYGICDYLSILIWKLISVSKRAPDINMVTSVRKPYDVICLGALIAITVSQYGCFQALTIAR